MSRDRFMFKQAFGDKPQGFPVGFNHADGLCPSLFQGGLDLGVNLARGFLTVIPALGIPFPAEEDLVVGVFGKAIKGDTDDNWSLNAVDLTAMKKILLGTATAGEGVDLDMIRG